jgi:hypothetical protein
MQGKKSFVLYTDLHETVKQLPDNKAGILFKTILAYVNDENPAVKDLLIKIAFEPVKLQLKRDLKKWEQEHAQRIEAGKISAEKRRLAKEQSEREATEVNDRSTTVDENQEASTVTGIVTVNDTVKYLIPDFSEFLDYAKTLNPYKPELDFSIKAKYDSWVSDGWKDGYGKKIKDWKAKLRNTILHLVPEKSEPKSKELITGKI